MIETFRVGIFGAVSGLTQFQVDTMRTELRELLKGAKTLTVCAWKDGRRYAKDDEDAVLLHVPALLLKFGERVSLQWHTYPVKCTSNDMELFSSLDARFFCPSEHASTQRSRVWKMKRVCCDVGLRVRIVYPWTSEKYGNTRGM